MGVPDLLHVLRENSDLCELFDRQQSRAQSIVNVMVVIGDFVRQIGELRFKRRTLPFHETRANLTEPARILQRAMFQDALTCLKAQIQAVECRIPLLEQIDDAQRLQVMFESAMRFHARVQRILSRVSKRRMAEVVRQ